MDKQSLIRALELEPHIEGGYFRRTYASTTTVGMTLTDNSPAAAANVQTPSRPLMSSIYYLLSDDRPLGHLHRNRSDIMHYWHAGGALTYWLLKPDGELTQEILGPDFTLGQRPQLLVPGGWWKATELISGEFGLLSEAVSPGFDFADMTLARFADIAATFPQHATALKRFCAR